MAHDGLRFHVRTLRLRKRLGAWGPLVGGFCALLLVFCLGIVCYMRVEGWSFFDSLYQVVITLSTVGFQEVYPLSHNGRVVTMLLIVTGVGSFAYLVGSFTQALVEGRLQQFFGRRRMQKIIDSLRDHVVICGYGRIGSIVAHELMDENVSIVVIESDPDVGNSLDEQGIPYVIGDATDDETLLAAGLIRAKTLVTALSQEAANVYVTLTARQFARIFGSWPGPTPRAIPSAWNGPAPTMCWCRTCTAACAWPSACCGRRSRTFWSWPCAVGASICRWKNCR